MPDLDGLFLDADVQVSGGWPILGPGSTAQRKSYSFVLDQIVMIHWEICCSIQRLLDNRIR